MVPTLKISKESKRYKSWMDTFGTDCVPVTSSITVMTHIKGGPSTQLNSEVYSLGPEWGLCYKVDILGLSPENRSKLLTAVADFLGRPESEVTSVVWGSVGVDIVDGPDLTMIYESQFAI